MTRNGDHRVSVLSVTGATVTYTGTDISANLIPYSLEDHAGPAAVTGNIGNGPTGGADTLSVPGPALVAPPRLVNRSSSG